MPLLEKEKIEDCPICNDVFSKDDVVYRPLLDGRVGKPYHKDCLESWCKRTGETCVDPVTRIKFNILHSKIKCNYDRPFRIELRADDEIILLGTEPCDQFYDIKKFISVEHHVPIEDITLYHVKGKDRIPTIDELFIQNDLQLELSIRSDIDEGDLYNNNNRKKVIRSDRSDDDVKKEKKDKNSMEKIAKQLTQIETLQKTEQLSPKEITTAAKQAVVEEDIFYDALPYEEEDREDIFYDIEETPQHATASDSRSSRDLSRPSVDDIVSKRDLSRPSVDDIDVEINSTKERIDEIDRRLSTLPRNDPMRTELEAIVEEEKNKYKELLVKGIRMLYENVKHVLSRFLSSSHEFVTDPEVQEDVQQFVSYVFRLLAMGAYSSLRLIALLGWEICKLIPKIIVAFRERDEEENIPSSSWFPSSSSSSSASDSSSSWFPSSSSSSSSWFSEEPEPDPYAQPFSAPKIRKRESPNIRFLRESGVDVSGAGFSGLRPGEVFRKGFMFSKKKSNRVRKMRK